MDLTPITAQIRSIPSKLEVVYRNSYKLSINTILTLITKFECTIFYKKMTRCCASSQLVLAFFAKVEKGTKHSALSHALSGSAASITKK